MKRFAPLFAVLAIPALAAVTLKAEPDRAGWELTRDGSALGSRHPTEEACWTAARADAAARRASGDYRCVGQKFARIEWSDPGSTPTTATAASAPRPDAHHGGKHPGDMPSYDPSTIPPPTRGHAGVRVSRTGEMPTPGDGVGAFRTVCTRSHFNRDDSLIFPNQPGRAHLHMYFGNTISDAASTPESLRSTGNSTCRGGIVNRSSYWVPAIIDTKDGAVIDMDRVDVYYKTGYRGVAASAVRPAPAGLRMIAGDMAARAPVRWGAASFRCGDKRDWGIPPNCTAPLEMHLIFPQCWDGKNLSSPDHKSHMAYANPPRGCPASHPVALPELSYIVHVDIPAGRNTATWRLSSDNYRGGQGGYSMHGDWINGWDEELPTVWTERVLNKGLSGGSHILGDGRVIY